MVETVEKTFSWGIEDTNMKNSLKHCYYGYWLSKPGEPKKQCWNHQTTHRLKELKYLLSSYNEKISL